MIRKVFVAGTSNSPPKGFGQSPQSRAVYGFDIMLKWQTSSKTGERSTHFFEFFNWNNVIMLLNVDRFTNVTSSPGKMNMYRLEK
jgi:hypothetical protein